MIGPVPGGQADLVLDSRLRGPRESGSLGPPQVAAGRMAGVMLRVALSPRFAEPDPVKRGDPSDAA